jgi:predicted RNA methylase
MTYAIPDAAPARVPLVCYFTKGLDGVVLAEIGELAPSVAVRQRDERFAVVDVDVADIAGFIAHTRTIDDLRLLLAGPVPIADEADFAELCARAGARAAELLADDRRATDQWSVTLSARNPVWRRAPQWQPDDIIRRWLHGADAHATARSAVDVRLQVDGGQAHAALNLTERPVGKDSIAPERRGALRPTVAAALVRLALAAVDLAVAGRGVYDPFCGTGTIVAEASRLGRPIFASDVDDAAVAATRVRLTSLARMDDAELAHRVFRHDVLRGVAARVTANVVVGNLPWGKQIAIDRRGELFDATAAIVARALDQAGSCALLTTHEDQLVARLRKRVGPATITSRRIGLLGQTPAIVLAESIDRDR